MDWRWRKMVDGHRWNSKVYAEDSRRNRSDAWNDFLLWRDELEERMKAQRTPEEQALHQAVDFLDHDADYSEMTGSPTAGTQRQLANMLRQMIGKQDQQAIAALLAELLGTDQDKRTDRLATVSVAKRKLQTDLMAETVADVFLKTHRQRARTGQITPGRFGKMRAGINRFLGWFGQKRDMRKMSEAIVTDYYNELLRLIEDEDGNSTTLADDWGLFKQFVDQMSDENPEIPKPRNLRNKLYTIGRTRREPDPFTPQEFRLIYDNASDQTKLYLLLMLNCSFYQGDIAELKASEVDWKAGRIIRARSKKTKIMAKKSKTDPIKINYRLWPETMRLLSEIGNRDGLVVLNENGGPVVVSKIKKDGVESRSDNVKSAYSRVVTKLKKQGLLAKNWNKQLKQLRKTGPNLLDDHDEYSQFVDVMLDHSRVANLSYLKTGKPYAKFDKALLWVGKQFGF